MKILVIGGIHGNEPLGLELVKLIEAKPIKNVDVVLGNERAIAQNSRFVKQDLNRSFPGNIKSKNYEEKKAAQLLKLCSNYDISLDFHNTYCPENNCSFVGQEANEYLYKVSSYLDLNRIIV
ncbi:MAG TPA: succinylglutamate desuccinylase/aspartoacylase family protein, partial [Candidatus Saccharimonadales bacterium]|nr:succinylglutamate desuccinylase/aspartoacylase family protein [Candidatus Saccharimonadales bacterium]